MKVEKDNNISTPSTLSGVSHFSIEETEAGRCPKVTWVECLRWARTPCPQSGAWVRVAPEENTVTLTKIDPPMKSFSGPWNAAISTSFWRETWPRPSEICS